MAVVMLINLLSCDVRVSLFLY